MPSSEGVVCGANRRLTSSMSNARTFYTNVSNTDRDSIPGCSKTRKPSREMRTKGMERPPYASASCVCVSTLPQVMSGCASAAASKTGVNARHGAHQEAHQSSTTMPGLLTMDSKFSNAICTVAMGPSFS